MKFGGATSTWNVKDEGGSNEIEGGMSDLVEAVR